MMMNDKNDVVVRALVIRLGQINQVKMLQGAIE